jgi:uncharacterized membrane protein
MQATRSRRPSQRRLIAAGLALGIGLGGFLDGILLHQILQAHNMLSAKLPPTSLVNVEINMFWDGVFHLVCWIVTAVGLAMLWNVARRQRTPLVTATLVGSLIAGWGLFNIVEGAVDHHILHLHHVVETEGHLLYDVAFLTFSLVLLVIGGLLIRAGQRQPRTAAATSSGTRSSSPV